MLKNFMYLDVLFVHFSDTDSPGGGGTQNSYSQVLAAGVPGDTSVTGGGGGGGGGLSSPDNASQSSAEAAPVTTATSNNHTAVASSSEESPPQSTTAAMQAYQNASAFPGMPNAGFYASQSQSPYGMLQQSYPMADG